MDNRKIIIASYVAISALLWLLTREGLAGIYGMFYEVRRWPYMNVVREVLPVVVALAAFFILFLNKRIGSFLDEVVIELKKVTWPSREDVVKSTVVVLGCVLFASCVLAFFDLVSGKVISTMLHWRS